jgi:hypothetical protein
MKATKAYIAGLGTTGVLIAGFFVLLAVGSALVAFNGWPGAAAGDELDRVVVEPESQLAPALKAERTDVRRVAQDARKRERGKAGAANSARRAAVRRGGSDTSAGLGADSAPNTGAGAAPGAAPSGGSGASGERGNGGGRRAGGLPELPAPEPDLGGTVDGATDGAGNALQGATGGVGDTVREVTGGAGETVGGVAPGVGETVTGTGETVGGVVDGAGQQANGVVDGVGETVGSALP